MNDGYRVVTFYPRWDFVILGVNQLINHLDKLEVMSDGEWKPNVIVRVGKGSDEPLGTGHQHKVIIQMHLNRWLQTVQLKN